MSAPRPAPRGDPLDSPACRRAVAALDGEEAAAAAVPRASAPRDARGLRVDPQLAASRRDAAAACLASRADPPAAALVRPPPVQVAPLVLDTAPPRNAHAAVPAAPPIGAATGPQPQRPYAITSCDAGGCWANDGTRLDRVGPSLWGPRGVCSVQGTLLQCP